MARLQSNPAALMALLNVVFGDSDPDAVHQHQCQRCEHIWEHARRNASKEQAHTCPECGAGPYYMQGTIERQQEALCRLDAEEGE